MVLCQNGQILAYRSDDSICIHFQAKKLINEGTTKRFGSHERRLLVDKSGNFLFASNALYEHRQLRYDVIWMDIN